MVRSLSPASTNRPLSSSLISEMVPLVRAAMILEFRSRLIS